MKIDINVDAILAKRGLGSDMRAGRMLAETAKKLMDKHVPMRNGKLITTAQLQNQYPKVLIIYNQPHAHYQYVGKAMGPSFQLKNGEWKSRSGQKKHYTGKEWGKSQNYDLCLNTGKLGLEQCADIIVDIVKNAE